VFGEGFLVDIILDSKSSDPMAFVFEFAPKYSVKGRDRRDSEGVYRRMDPANLKEIYALRSRHALGDVVVPVVEGRIANLMFFLTTTFVRL
jgi:hypothetical protein